MIPLSNATLDHLPQDVLKPSYSRADVRPGIAHIGVGNFHRAHQAHYVEQVLALPGQAEWGIVGLGIRHGRREEERREAFRKQDSLFTLTEFASDGTKAIHAIGSIVEYVSCLDEYEGVIHRLTDPAIRIVSLTITEGGYYVDGQGRFQLDHPDIAEDLTRDVPQTAFGIVTEALKRRRAAGVGPFTVLSCDNLQENGKVARTAFCGFADARDAELGAWMREKVTFPCAMVDRIAPSIGAADIERLDRESGVADMMPVYSEDFTQWVIENSFCAGRPALEKVGVQFTSDVAPYEQVKLRMLNAAHSTLAYAGLLMGYRRVDKAIADEGLATLVETFLNEDVAPLLTPPADVNVTDYARLVLNRFRNPEVGDQLERIASGGLAKLPVFLGPTVKQLLEKGRDARREAFTLACWAECYRDVNGTTGDIRVSDPQVTEQDKAALQGEDPQAILGLPVFAGWGVAENATFAEHFASFRKGLKKSGAKEVLAGVLKG
ncbi:NADPH-dependent L-sorbose reductase [Acetobacter estunensis NRIC 0472]|uniref:Mannitol dehydrogenase family protein n=1 Tax=Acetobacter estunensis TaxID=104097 RepID=A0A967B8I6_9PROT|nr:mannitol dehydrogenase family protein [Acetobacter estunensis]NHO55094.1 mannitol dehydrogenase family protein [Acetobacter estunensis]GBQ27074.1 NADPH-dependent L-sorbose reductase [Acetobacter estunensis NRIC 0472]